MEFKLPLCLLFVYHEKASDSTELNAILRALVEVGIDENYIEIVKEANSSCSTDVALFANQVRIIEKGVR